MLIIKDVTPTVFLANKDNILQQLISVTVINNMPEAINANLVVSGKGVIPYEINIGIIPSGESVHQIFIIEITCETDLKFYLKSGEIESNHMIKHWIPPKHWVVHIVQSSHHDIGYTDIPSKVLLDHYNWLNNVIDMADETDTFPDDARFRAVIEQAWSLEYFMKNAKEARVQRMLELMLEGRIEVAALFGNMTTEICGHESLIRALYHSFRMKRLYAIELATAEHNDITGFSWGLSGVLADAGIKMLCLGIPLYYSWSSLKMQSFWNEKELFSHNGPGAFWWEAPSGKCILIWCNNIGCNGDSRGDFPELSNRLNELNEQNYPYSIIRWPVNSATRDNSPYIKDYSYNIKKWNEKWAFPHLVCSTNTKFYNEFIKEVPDNLKVIKGELPGQDYPLGSTSMAAESAVNRNNHTGLIVAEKLASAASMTTDYIYQKEKLFQAYEDVLYYDEHVWGYHFPCGAAMKASLCEKAVHAHRSAAFIHEVKNKAMARIADNLKLDDKGYYLVVFNMSPDIKTDSVNAQLREIDNCGSDIVAVPAEEDPKKSGYLRGVLLSDRWHLNLTDELLDGKFILKDISSDESVPFQINEISSAYDTVQYAPERLGLGSGSKRYGFFEEPYGLKRDLCFIAKDVPAFGYKTYQLIPSKSDIEYTANLKTGDSYIENKYYRITVDKKTGTLLSIYDKKSDREIIDTDCKHNFYSVIARTPDTNTMPPKEYIMEKSAVEIIHKGSVCTSIEITGSFFGHPIVKHTITLYDGLKQISFDTKILKDSTPLLDVHIAFPFYAANPKFRYEGVLSAINSITDYLPGAYSDTVAVQNWVKVEDGNYNILWSSLDAPICGFSKLWSGYVSPAHRCLIDEKANHPPQTVADMNKGWIYSNIFYNNFGTNFPVSQVGDNLFRYILTTCEGNVSDRQAAAFGWNTVTPFEQILTCKNEGRLPTAGSFIKIADAKVILIAFKKAEDDNGFILRLWNMEDSAITTEVSLNYIKIKEAIYTNVVEEDIGELKDYDNISMMVFLEKNTMVSVRIVV